MMWSVPIERHLKIIFFTLSNPSTHQWSLSHHLRVRLNAHRKVDFTLLQNAPTFHEFPNVCLRIYPHKPQKIWAQQSQYTQTSLGVARSWTRILATRYTGLIFFLIKKIQFNSKIIPFSYPSTLTVYSFFLSFSSFLLCSWSFTRGQKSNKHLGRICADTTL